MTKSFTDNFEMLLADLRAAEETRDRLKRLQAEGGEHLLTIAVKHPDPEVSAAADRVAADMLPHRIIIDQMVRCAVNAASTARENLFRHVDASRNLEAKQMAKASTLRSVPDAQQVQA